MKIERVEEPELLFKDCKSTYCKIGLSETGPYLARKGIGSNRITLGIIGTKELIEKTKNWINLCGNYIESKPHKEKDEISKDLFPDFPGCEYAFHTNLVVDDQFVQYIPVTEYGRLDRKNYTQGLLNIFRDKLNLMFEISTDLRPDVILCLLTDEMYDYGHIAGNYHRRLRRRKQVDPNQLNLFRDIVLW